MYPMPGRCPVCGDELYVERLVCVQCGTSIQGAFLPQRLSRLTSEQLDFVELFLRSEGKLNVMRAMGFEVGDTDADEVRTQSVLDKLAAGETTVEDALRLLTR
jgi:hypothetical protein